MHAAGRDGVARIGAESLYRRLAVAALSAMALTGIALFSVKAGEYAANPAFRTKMVLLALALANVAFYHAAARTSARLRRLSIAVSAAIWPAILLAGRFIGFV